MVTRSPSVACGASSLPEGASGCSRSPFCHSVKKLSLRTRTLAAAGSRNDSRWLLMGCYIFCSKPPKLVKRSHRRSRSSVLLVRLRSTRRTSTGGLPPSQRWHTVGMLECIFQKPIGKPSPSCYNQVVTQTEYFRDRLFFFLGITIPFFSQNIILTVYVV